MKLVPENAIVYTACEICGSRPATLEIDYVDHGDIKSAIGCYQCIWNFKHSTKNTGLIIPYNGKIEDDE
jgi:hypothetical protein